MADKKLSDVTSVEDFDYFLGVKSNGDVQKMSKDSMKKVISELMSSFLQIDSPKNFIVSNPSNMETGIISIGDASREISKSEKLNGPSEDIPFIRGMDSNGNPIYIGTEQFSSVLAGLIDFPFKYRDRVDINTDANNLTGSGFYAVYCWGEDIASKHYPIELGHIIVFQDGAGGSVSQLAISDNGTSYTRMRWGLDSWSAWRQLS